MPDMLLRHRVQLVNLQDVLFTERPLVPAILEKHLPHAILYQNRIFLLMDRSRALYKEVIPHLLEYKPINGAH